MATQRITYNKEHSTFVLIFCARFLPSTPRSRIDKLGWIPSQGPGNKGAVGLDLTSVFL